MLKYFAERFLGNILPQTNQAQESKRAVFSSCNTIISLRFKDLPRLEMVAPRALNVLSASP